MKLVFGLPIVFKSAEFVFYLPQETMRHLAATSCIYLIFFLCLIDENNLNDDTGGLLGKDFFPGENYDEFSGDTIKLSERLEQWVADKISKDHQKSGNSNPSLPNRVSTVVQ